MKTILHLERKFTSKTETFIINQINTITKFNVIVATIKNENNLPCYRKVIFPEKINRLYANPIYLTKKTLKSLLFEISKYKIDLIHIHYLVDAIFFIDLVKILKVPTIVSAYGYDVSSFPKMILGVGKFFLKKVFEDINYFIAMSQDMAHDLINLGCPKDKIIIHYYGTDTKKFLNLNRNYEIEKKVKILTVGSLEEKKAQHLVLEALALLVKKFGFEFEYHLVGSGPYEKEIRRRINLFGFHNKVFLHGYVPYLSPNFINFYNDADIFVHPSITDSCGDKEGIPGTIVEAMANALPVISTYHAGIPYIITDGKEGLLVKEKDIEGIAYAILKLTKNKELREYLGRNAQKKALEELDLYKGTERLEKIYEMIINGNGKVLNNYIEVDAEKNIQFF